MNSLQDVDSEGKILRTSLEKENLIFMLVL